MSDLRKLENLYNEKIKIDNSEASYYRGLLRHLLERELIPEMRRLNPDFAALYSHTYFGGSVFDGLKVHISASTQNLAKCPPKISKKTK